MIQAVKSLSIFLASSLQVFTGTPYSTLATQNLHFKPVLAYTPIIYTRGNCSTLASAPKFSHGCDFSKLSPLFKSCAKPQFHSTFRENNGNFLVTKDTARSLPLQHFFSRCSCGGKRLQLWLRAWPCVSGPIISHILTEVPYDNVMHSSILSAYAMPPSSN